MANNHDFQSLKALIGPEADNNDNYYRDPDHISTVHADINNGKKDSISVELAKWIRQKKFGIDVREALARFIEWVSVLMNKAQATAETAKETSETVESNYAALEEREKAFEENLMGKYNRQIAGNTDINEVIDARDSKTGENYTTLGERLNMMDELKLKDLTDKTFTVKPNLDIGDGRIIKPAKAFADKLDQSKMNITAITDGHEQDWFVKPGETVDYPYGYLATTHLNAFLEIAEKSDLSIALGDNANGLFPEKERTVADLSLYADKLIYADTDADVAIIPGNHDDGSPKTFASKLPVNNIITNDEMKEILKTADLRFGETRNNGDSLYFFKDYPEKRVRVIALYSEDVPEAVANDEGTLKYPRWYWHGYMQAQITWLADVALRNVPADYHTVFMAHAPLEGSGWNDNDANAKYVNNDIVIGLIDAFQRGGAYATTSDGGNFGVEWAVSIAADFSPQGSRTVVGWFNGHKHRERIFTPADSTAKFPMIWLLNDVCGSAKDVGTDKEYAMTTIEINTATRTVNLKGFGRATNRSYNY